MAVAHLVVETNYNHWERPPITDPRRHAVAQCMDSVGQANITPETLYKCLSVIPILNPFSYLHCSHDPTERLVRESCARVLLVDVNDGVQQTTIDESTYLWPTWVQ